MNPIFFIHLPKSGGSTVSSFFGLNKGEGQYINLESTPQYWKNDPKKLLETGIGGGHHPYGIHRSLRAPLRYCTVLRDPLERHISHYWYAFNGKNGEVDRGAIQSHAEALVRRGKMTLDEWVNNSCGGKSLYTHFLGGNSSSELRNFELALHNIYQGIITVGICEDMNAFLLRLCGIIGFNFPFYVELNKTKRLKENFSKLSDAARQKFIEDNKFDYNIYTEVKKAIASEPNTNNLLFDRALEVVSEIQSTINKLDNPYINKSVVYGCDQDYLLMVRNVACNFDMSPIEEYIQFVQNQPQGEADCFDGFVDSVIDNTVSGWAINLSHPEQPITIEVIIGDEVVAKGQTGQPRFDVHTAGYPSTSTGFSIDLPDCASDGFRVAISGTKDWLNDSGIWRKGWHLA